MSGSEKAWRPRLLIVTRDRFPPFRVDLTELFSRWLTPQFDIDWVMERDGKGVAEASAGRPGERFLTSRRGVFWLILQLRHGLRAARGEVDLVQVRDAAFSAAFFSLAARAGGRPFVYWMSYPMAEGYRYRARRQTPSEAPLLRLARFAYGAAAALVLDRFVLPLASHVFVQSERMKADVAAKGVPPERMTAAPMGVSVDLYNPATIPPTDYPRLEGRKVLVYVGALDPERQIQVLVGALAMIVERGVDAVLVLVGAAPEAQRLRLNDEARRRGVTDRLAFTGHLPLIQALAYVRRADVCLSPFPVQPPTYLSATPTKLVEYLAMGRPVVASDHPDQRLVIEDSGAGLISTFTAEGFAAAIGVLLADLEAAEAMGARGPQWVAENRDYAAISKTVAEVYRRLIARNEP